MEELSIEEKAKAYDEALERMKSWVRGEHPECFTEAQKAAEFIFPELAESEDDKIRKALIRFHKSTIDVDGIKGEDIIAWLEKQGTSYTKRDVDDAFVEGIALTKYELEKRGEKKTIKQLDIEIPFGAKDSELIEESYYIPKGYHAEISKDKVTIKKGEQEPTWSEKDEAGLCDALWAIKQAKRIAKDENDMGNLWYAENWLKSLKQRMGG